jgi:hypothetical protein
MLRQLIRWIASSLVSLGMIVAVEPVVHVNVEHLAKQRHWDEFLAKWWPEVPYLSAAYRGTMVLVLLRGVARYCSSTLDREVIS